MTRSQYYLGEVYTAKWLYDSIEEGKLLDKSFYEHDYVGAEVAKKFELEREWNLYTIREGYKVYEIV